MSRYKRDEKTGLFLLAEGSQRLEKHHTIQVAKNIDWHLRNLWEGSDGLGGWRCIEVVEPGEHHRRHGSTKGRGAA